MGKETQEVKESELLKIINDRVNENDEKGIDSIVMLSPDHVSVIGYTQLMAIYYKLIENNNKRNHQKFNKKEVFITCNNATLHTKMLIKVNILYIGGN